MGKVLIISCNCLSISNCNGKTIRELFINSPEDEIAQIYTCNEIPNYKSKVNFYRITDKDIVRFRFKRKEKCGEKIIDFSPDSVAISSSLRGSLFENEMRLARDIIWHGKSWAGNGLDSWLQEYKPDWIFFVGINNPYLYRYCIHVQRQYNIPCLVYTTDDYFCARFSLSIGFWIRLFTLNLNMKRLLSHPKTGLLTINEVMQLKYEKKFQKKSKILTHYIIGEYEKYAFLNTKKSYIISYIGNLSHNRWKSIIEFSEAIYEKKDGEKIAIHVYVAEPIPSKVLNEFSKCKNIVIGRSLNAEEVPQVMKESDYLLHVESFLYDDMALARYSLSTKITEYANACRPIIAFCPNQVASYKILKKHNLGICIDNIQEECVNDVLKKMMDKDYLANIVDNAYHYFDSLRMEYDMENLLQNEVTRLTMNEDVK